MEQLKNLLQNDPSPTKPKIIKNSKGKFTRAFLKWNRSQIVEGKTYFYADKTKLFSAKLNAVIRKDKISPTQLNKSNIYQSVLYPKDTNLLSFRYEYKTTLFIGSEGYSSNSNDLKDNLLLDTLIKQNGINGDYRLIIKANDDKLIDVYDNFNNGWFSKNQNSFRAGSIYMIWNDPNAISEGEIITFIFTKDNKIPFKFYAQKFLDGANHCIFYPINEYMITQLENAKAKTTKQKYQAKINMIMGRTLKSGEKKIGLMETYKLGVPEKDLPLVCESLQIGIDIQQPFNDTKLFEYRSNKKPLKVFKFVNSRLNHVERNEKPILRDTIFKSYDAITITPDEMKSMHDNLKKNNEFMIFNKNLYDISSIRTLDNFYVLDNYFNKIYTKWEIETGLDKCYIDYNKYIDLGVWIQNATHFNGTVDFFDTSKFKQLPNKNTEPNFYTKGDDYNKLDEIAMHKFDEIIEGNIPENMRHIDMTKAYTQFKQSKFYSGFVGRITDFRQVENYDEKGLYYITNINLDNCSEKFIKLNFILGWFVNDNIYTDAELKALSHYGGTFDVTHGCYGTKIDFEFNEDMINKKDDCRLTDKIKPIPFYAKWTGLKSASYNTSSFFMYGDEDYFSTIQDTTENKIYYDETEKMGRIQTYNKYRYSLKHIPTQILAYQRLIMLEQLLEMDISKIQRVCVDGIYYFDHKFERLTCFSHKTDMTFNNDPAECYLSNINDNEFISNIVLPEAKPRPHYLTELFIGAGGNGKTYHNLTDKGFINLVYVGHSWKLATGKHKDFGVFATVHNRLYSYNDKETTFKNNVLVIDECSMVTELQKTDIISTAKEYGCKVIFCGDIGHQLPPIEGNEMTSVNIDNIINLKKNYRFKCNKLIKLLENVRKQIEDPNGNYFKMTDLHSTKEYGNFIKTEELKKLYKKEDIILTHARQNRYCDLFKDIEKYRITNNTKRYKNGEIVYKEPKEGGVTYEKRHGYTTHSIQGETFENNIFIDYQQICNSFFDLENNTPLRLFYTAISRARYMNQIYFVIPEHF